MQASTSSGKVVAASCGLAGFAIAVIAGLSVDNPADVILTRAIVAMIICNVVGWMFGSVLQRVFRESVAQYAARAEQAQANVAPVPQSTANPQQR